MATEKRTSEQGNVFSVTTIREFLLAALNHDAVTDAVDAMLYEHVFLGRFHQSVITENLRPLIMEVLEVATSADWQNVSAKLIEDARETFKDDLEALGDDLESQSSRRTAQREPDPGELREELADLYTHDLLSPSKARRAWNLVRKLSRFTGISRETIQAEATADAEAIQAVREFDAVRANQSSGHTPAPIDTPEVIDAGTPPLIAAQRILRHVMDNGGTVHIEDTKGNEVEGWVTGLTEDEVSIQVPGTSQATYIPLAEIASLTETDIVVRPLLPGEALVLLQKGDEGHSLARKRAAIILASNLGCTVTQIVAAQKVEESFARKVITDFNERGLDSLESSTPTTTITLDTGQFNLLISGLGLARLALNGCGDEYVGFAADYMQLADEIVAQLPGDGPAPRAAQERLAIREGRAISIRKRR